MEQLLGLPIVATFVALFSGTLGWAIATHFPQAANQKDAPPGALHKQTLIFEHGRLVHACRVARKTLSPDFFEDGAEDRLIDQLSDVFRKFRHTFEAARLEGTRFELSDETTQGPVSVAFIPENGAHRFEVFGLPDLGISRVLMDRRAVEIDARELTHLRDTLSAAPYPVWREEPTGEINWANRAYFEILEQMEELDSTAWPPPRLMEGGLIVRPGEQARAKRCSLKLENGDQKWFEVASFGLDRSSVHFATEISGTIRAEEALHNFVQTLTQTFAALPIGLAIFDKNRRLALFNPALSDLTGLEPDWMISRPTLYDVINALREKRMVPERKDFGGWRQTIAALEASAQSGQFEETWNLPTGQIFRVTGRPHPNGAVAFMIEDATAEISLARKFRTKLELGQSLIDTLPEAIAVFGPDGELTFCNESYRAMWPVPEGDDLGSQTILDASKIWQAASLASPIWGDLRDFAISPGERAEWSGAVDMEDGQTLACRFAPLPGGATLVGFTGDMLMPPQPMPSERLELSS